MGAPARVRRARRGDRAGDPRRHHRALVPAEADLHRARRPCPARLLPHGHDRAGDLARLAAQAYARAGATLGDDRVLQQIAIVTTAVIYAQIIAGATMRHNEAGLAIPDFPLAFGQLVPPHWDLKIALHFAHRVGALVVTALVLATTGHVFFHHRHRPRADAAGRRCCSSLLDGPDHARRADGAERPRSHHQLAARGDRRAGARHVARADAARAPRRFGTAGEPRFRQRRRPPRAGGAGHASASARTA